MNTESEKRACRIKDLLGYSLWLLWLLAGLVLIAALYWLKNQEALGAAVPCAILILLSIWFAWTRLVRRPAQPKSRPEDSAI